MIASVRFALWFVAEILHWLAPLIEAVDDMNGAVAQPAGEIGSHVLARPVLLLGPFLGADAPADIHVEDFGLLPNVVYDRMIVKPEPRDLIVLYSDGVSEATNPAGRELGRDDLLTLARAIDPSSADAFGMQLVQAVSEFRAGRVPEDDVTLIVLQRLSAQPAD